MKKYYFGFERGLILCGAVCFVWIMNQQIFAAKNNISKEQQWIIAASKRGLQDDLIRATFILKQEYLEKIKAYAYWERLQIKEVFDDMCEQFFKDKVVLPIPQKKK